MTTKLTIVSCSTVLAAVTLACSAGPEYKSTYNKGTQAANSGLQPEVGHGTDTKSDDSKKGTEVAKDIPAPSSAPTPTPSTPAAPAANAKSDADRAKEMNAKGFVAYAVNAPNGAGWNNAGNPYLIAPSVTAANAVDTAKPFDTFFCAYRLDGQTLNTMTIHSGTNNGPMAHGSAIQTAALAAGQTVADAQKQLDGMTKEQVAAMPNCRPHRVAGLNAAPGATYNHQGGAQGNAASHIFFKVMTVDPSGTVK